MRAQQIETFQHKDQIFEHKQKPQVGDQSADYRQAHRLFASEAQISPKTKTVIEEDGAHHDQNEPRLSPGIKKQGGQQQQPVLRRTVLPEKTIIEKEHDGKKGKEKN
ncbi:hypothetical protein SDC9_89102 [bioreactor metagenome]|uniref:Uncharacterized protein n=1 Tax=bioreactor metagenome TaxID=1076179 RepID=A0A644ZNY1_9ZZZZ